MKETRGNLRPFIHSTDDNLGMVFTLQLHRIKKQNPKHTTGQTKNLKRKALHLAIIFVRIWRGRGISFQTVYEACIVIISLIPSFYPSLSNKFRDNRRKQNNTNSWVANRKYKGWAHNSVRCLGLGRMHESKQWLWGLAIW